MDQKKHAKKTWIVTVERVVTITKRTTIEVDAATDIDATDVAEERAELVDWDAIESHGDDTIEVTNVEVAS